MKLQEAMTRRRSVRKFWPDPVPRLTLEKLVAAAMLAPTGCNTQGWIFVVVDDAQIRRQIAAEARYGGFIAEAGACIAVFCEKTALCIVEDCSAATQNLMLAAVEEGLGTCWIHSHGQDHAPAIEKLLGCPQTHELVVLVAVGVPDGTPVKPEKKFIGDVLKWNKF